MRPRTHVTGNRNAHRPRDARRRGSVIILVVVVLVLMVLLGTAYLQSARFDQQAAEIQKQAAVDQVARAQLNYIQRILRDDLIHEEGGDTFFLSDHESNEPYDYPFTNPNDPGVRDDTWLASTEGTYGAPSVWPHVTNLNGVFLTLPEPDPEDDGIDRQPIESPLTAGQTGTVDADTDLEIGDVTFDGDTFEGVFTMSPPSGGWELGLGADTDGDGIQDARWTWAAMKQVGDVQYVAAVRIVDLSSMVNLDTAMSSVEWDGTAATYDTSAPGTNAPRWWYPSEINLGQFLAAHQVDEVELEDLLEYRLGEDADTRTETRIPWQDGSASSRFPFWLHGPRVHGDFNQTAPGTTFYQPLGPATEMELRRRNGLSLGDRAGGILRDLMPGFVRGAGESDFSDVDLSVYDSGWPSEPDPGEFFQYEPLHLLTTMSGVSNIGPTLRAEDGRLTRTSINEAAATGNTTNLRDTIDAVFGDLEVWSTGLPGGFNPDPAASPNQVEIFAAQFAANIVDYVDADSILTNVDDRYGLEALPFIAEVYAQGRYEVTLDPTWSGPGDYDVSWDRVGNGGYAIEIRNPFRRTIPLDTVHLYVNGVEWGVSLADLAGVTTLNPGATVVLLRDSNNNGDPPNDDVDPLVDTTDSPIVEDIDQVWVWPTDADGAVVNVELRAEDSTGAQIVYCRYPTEGLPDTIDEGTNITLSADPTGTVDYRQVGAMGNGNGLNMLTVVDSDVTIEKKNPNRAAPSLRQTTGYDQLGLADKTPQGISDAFDPDAYQIIIRNDPDDRLHQIGELAQITLLGPTETTTVAEEWDVSAASNPEDLMLDFDPFASGTGTGNRVAAAASHPNLELPPAMVLIDRLSTYNLEDDGVDNDGDGNVDEDDEQFEPGRINLNSAPRRVLLDSLPISDADARANGVDALINYRDRPAEREYYRRDPELLGIASLGELMTMFNVTNTGEMTPGTGAPYGTDLHPLTGAALGTAGSDTYQLPNFPGPAGMTRIDFDVPDLSAGGEGVVDDREEEAMVMRWLSQVGAVRSDRFVVYMVIRGYPADDFRQGPVEQKRVVAILDRSTVTDADEPVRILAVREF